MTCIKERGIVSYKSAGGAGEGAQESTARIRFSKKLMKN
jgi:hypothetical protein